MLLKSEEKGIVTSFVSDTSVASAAKKSKEKCLKSYYKIK